MKNRQFPPFKNPSPFDLNGGFFQMKKIVGILAAAAIATSVFAADVSASTKIDGTLFSFVNIILSQCYVLIK